MPQTIHTDQAPAAIGPYSQAVVAGNLVFCAGQIGLHPATGNLAPGIEAQTKQTLQNIGAVLLAAGTGPDKVLKTTVFLKNLADFQIVNQVYGDFFGAHKPARVTVEISNLPKGALIEIEAMAVVE